MATQSLWEARYVVVDVETTGHNPQQHRIIEVACLVLEAGQLTERLVSLVNAHQPVPPSITALTGITNGMLSTAPEEASVFAQVARLLSPPDTILVGHNVAFDWKFLCATLERLGYHGFWNLPRLCTYRLARRLLPPTLRRRGLDALIEYFGLTVTGRHRAGPDAEATAAILQHLLECAASSGISSPAELLHVQYAPRLHTLSRPRRIQVQLEQLPSSPGIYRFYDRRGRLLYVGKAQDLRQRVRSHFDADGAFAHHPVWTIRWEETPTELSALLREIEIIWQEQPLLNVVGKRLDTYSFVRLTYSESFPRLVVTEQLPQQSEDIWLGPLPNRKLAEQLAEFLQRWYRLRPCTSQLRKAPHEQSCLYAHLGTCTAPCDGTTSPEAYRQQVEQLLSDATYHPCRWYDALSVALEQHIRAWEFERAAHLRPLWRFLQRWAQNGLPLAFQRCSFALAIPLETGKGAEVICFQAGVFRGMSTLESLHHLDRVRELLRHWEEDPQPSWLDVAWLDLLSRWVAQHRSGLLLQRLPSAPGPELSFQFEAFCEQLAHALPPREPGGSVYAEAPPFVSNSKS